MCIFRYNYFIIHVNQFKVSGDAFNCIKFFIRRGRNGRTYTLF